MNDQADGDLDSFFEATKNHDRKAIQTGLQRGIDINVVDKEASTLLPAAELGKSPLEWVEFLIQSGADLNGKDSEGNTPLVLAIRYNDFSVARTLLQNGARGDVADSLGNTPLYYLGCFASEEPHRATELLSLLLKQGVDVNASDVYGNTPFMLALRERHFDLARMLWKAGARMDITNVHGETPLHVLGEIGFRDPREWADFVLLMLKDRADVDLLTTGEEVPLIHASQEATLGSFQAAILEAGSAVRRANLAGESPLNVLCGKGVLDPYHGADIISHFHGDDVNAVDIEGNTPLMSAVRRGNPIAVRILLEAGAHVHAANKKEETALHMLVLENHKHAAEIISVLATSGADLNARGKMKITPLMLTIDRKRLDMARWLLEAGAGVDVADVHGRTPLMEVIHRQPHNLAEFILLLLEHGADVKAQDRNGFTPLCWAFWCWHPVSVRLILEAGARVDVATRERETPLHMLCMVPYLDSPELTPYPAEFIPALLERGADINTSGLYGATPLIRAVHYGNLDAARKLIEAGAALDMTHEEGGTALHVAAEQGLMDLVALLLEFSAAKKIKANQSDGEPTKQV